jgi:hypothetical protein
MGQQARAHHRTEGAPLAGATRDGETSRHALRRMLDRWESSGSAKSATPFTFSTCATATPSKTASTRCRACPGDVPNFGEWKSDIPALFRTNLPKLRAMAPPPATARSRRTRTGVWRNLDAAIKRPVNQPACSTELTDPDGESGIASKHPISNQGSLLGNFGPLLFRNPLKINMVRAAGFEPATPSV